MPYSLLAPQPLEITIRAIEVEGQALGEVLADEAIDEELADLTFAPKYGLGSYEGAAFIRGHFLKHQRQCMLTARL